MWHNRGRLTFTGDFNGDGAPDTGALTLLSKEKVKLQVIYSGKSIVVTTKVMISSGLASLVMEEDSRVVTGDFNGDKKDDFVILGMGQREACPG
jgi:hypothetical protein